MESLRTLDITNAITSKLWINVMNDICKAMKYSFIAIKVHVIMNQFKASETYFKFFVFSFHVVPSLLKQTFKSLVFCVTTPWELIMFISLTLSATNRNFTEYSGGSIALPITKYCVCMYG